MPSHLCELLVRYGHEAYVNCANLDYFDVTVVLGLWHVREELMDNKIVLYGCGSDVWDNPKLDAAIPFLETADLVLYGHPEMAGRTGVYGRYWQLPVDTSKFFDISSLLKPTQKRDTVIYCPSPGTYKLHAVMQYVEDNPKEKITILGGALQDIWMEDMPENVLSVRSVPYDCMRQLYYNHKKSMKWVSHKATPFSKMDVEAMLCGCRAYSNGAEIKKFPDTMLDSWAIPELIRMLKNIG